MSNTSSTAIAGKPFAQNHLTDGPQGHGFDSDAENLRKKQITSPPITNDKMLTKH